MVTNLEIQGEQVACEKQTYIDKYQGERATRLSAEIRNEELEKMKEELEREKRETEVLAEDLRQQHQTIKR